MKSRPWPNCSSAYYLVTSLAETVKNQESSHSSSQVLIHQHYSPMSQPLPVPRGIANNFLSVQS